MNRRDALKSTSLFFGFAASSAALTNLFISCTNEKKLDWKPVFLDNNQAATIAEITERILPKTKTPGAKELHIDKFIDKMLKDLLSPDEQKDFMKGFDAFEVACKEKYNKNFVECTQQQQEEFLKKMAKDAAKFPPSVWGISLASAMPTPFFRKIKELTLLGYYTSQEIGKNVLRYDPLPGAYIACMPLAQVGNAWNE